VVGCGGATGPRKQVKRQNAKGKSKEPVAQNFARNSAAFP
jgi:hypothetical protein